MTMELRSKRWYNSWWAILLVMLLGSLAGWLLRGCYLDGWSGINL